VFSCSSKRDKIVGFVGLFCCFNSLSSFLVLHSAIFIFRQDKSSSSSSADASHIAGGLSMYSTFVKSSSIITHWSVEIAVCISTDNGANFDRSNFITVFVAIESKSDDHIYP